MRHIPTYPVKSQFKGIDRYKYSCVLDHQFLMITKNGQRGQKMSFYDTMRDAYSSRQATTRSPQAPLKPHMPATTDTRSANTSGDVIDGEFEMIRAKSGQMIFVGIDGQYIKR